MACVRWTANFGLGSGEGDPCLLVLDASGPEAMRIHQYGTTNASSAACHTSDNEQPSTEKDIAYTHTHIYIYTYTSTINNAKIYVILSHTNHDRYHVFFVRIAMPSTPAPRQCPIIAASLEPSDQILLLTAARPRWQPGWSGTAKPRRGTNTQRAPMPLGVRNIP